VGDEVVNWQTKGVDNYPRGNKLGIVFGGVLVGIAIIGYIIIVSTCMFCW
jgi:hypothetical protein